MLAQLQNPQYLEGLATGIALGLIAGMAIMAALFFHAESRREARKQRRAVEAATRQAALFSAKLRLAKAEALLRAETASWPANDDPAVGTGSSTPRAELRRAPR